MKTTEKNALKGIGCKYRRNPAGESICDERSRWGEWLEYFNNCSSDFRIHRTVAYCIGPECGKYVYEYNYETDGWNPPP